MKKSLYSFLTLAALTTIFITGCKVETEKKETKTVASSQEDLVKRGEYLVTVGGCDDCHSPKVFWTSRTGYRPGAETFRAS